MPAGQDAEELVAILESTLAGPDVLIQQRARIPDLDTGQSREVDVAIRAKVGSHELLIILEVRDRRSEQDVTWVEQLATKRRSVGAHKAIAVSRSGFTEPAYRKAAACGVELRTLQEFRGAEAALFLGLPVRFRHSYQQITALSAQAGPADDANEYLAPDDVGLNSAEPQAFEVKPAEKLLRNQAGESFSFNDMLHWPAFQEKVAALSASGEVEHEFFFGRLTDALYVDRDGGVALRIYSIRIRAHVTLTSGIVEPSQVDVYRGAEEIARRLRFIIPAQPEPVVFEFILAPVAGGMRIRAQKRRAE